jgi:hypothetical protein
MTKVRCQIGALAERIGTRPCSLSSISAIMLFDSKSLHHLLNSRLKNAFPDGHALPVLCDTLWFSALRLPKSRSNRHIGNWLKIEELCIVRLRSFESVSEFSTLLSTSVERLRHSNPVIISFRSSPCQRTEQRERIAAYLKARRTICRQRYVP